VSNENLTTHTVYRDTLVSLLRDLEVCRELMVSDPFSPILIDRYFTTMCLVFTASTGDKLTRREAKRIFFPGASAKEKREAYGS
jgi:hypothetical protein